MERLQTGDRRLEFVTEEEALLALDQFAERWDSKYPQSQSQLESLLAEP